jgi:MinD-like ATPase involved in chromosome partitioning or flagellar assembly
VLNQSVPLAWALQPTPKPSLQVLAAGRSVSEPALADFPKLIAQLKQWFDWILIDGGVWGAHSSRDALVAHSDAVYAVAERPDTAGALRQAIPRHGGLLRGVVTARRD